MNPLFASDDDDKPAKRDSGYVLPNRHGRRIEPLHPIHAKHTHPAQHAAHTNPQKQAAETAEPGSAQAVELIRRKLDNLFAEEPDAATEAVVVSEKPEPVRSPHQQFMYDLSTSGRSLAEIQTAWHQYYAKLSDEEKHQVWQEFYSNNNTQHLATPQAAQAPSQTLTPAQAKTEAPQSPVPQPVVTPVLPSRFRPTARAEEPGEDRMPVVSGYEAPLKRSGKKRKAAAEKTAAQLKAIKHRVAKNVNLSTAAQTKAIQHAKSLLFGLTIGAVVLLIVLFGLFNEVVLAPFIQPSRTASATPIILGSDSVAPSETPEVIIPKISVQIPVDYTLQTVEEEAFQKALESGVVHYYTTSKPGEKGNTSIFGHSSNNILNPGKYKFAFVKLSKLVPGDIFYLTYNKKVYTYRVYDKRVVSPSDVSVLSDVPDKTATATLITCDPPGTSLNRLVVWGEQVSPDPNGNAAASEPQAGSTEASPSSITGNGPPIWKRVLDWFQ